MRKFIKVGLEKDIFCFVRGNTNARDTKGKWATKRDEGGEKEKRHGFSAVEESRNEPTYFETNTFCNLRQIPFAV